MEGTDNTGTGTTGPATFAEAFAADASSASTPSGDSAPAASASAATTEPPVANATPDGTTPATGEPPKERWPDILANAREKAIAEWRQQHGWAEQVNAQEFQQIQRIARHFAGGDVESGLRSLLAELGQDPQAAQVLRSLHARELAKLRGQSQGPDLNPIQVQLENGQTVGLYTAEQIAALRNQWLADAQQQFQPIAQTVQTLQQREAALQQQAAITQYVETTYSDVQTWPGMDDAGNRKAVADTLAQMRVDDDDPRAVSLALNAAYRQVVLPKLSQKAQATLLDDLKTKAAASTSVNPGSTAATAQRAYKSFADLGPEMWR